MEPLEEDEEEEDGANEEHDGDEDEEYHDDGGDGDGDGDGDQGEENDSIDQTHDDDFEETHIDDDIASQPEEVHQEDDEQAEGVDAAEEAEIERLEKQRQTQTRSDRFTTANKSTARAVTPTPSSLKTSYATDINRNVDELDDEMGDEAVVDENTRIKGLCTEMCPAREVADRIEMKQISVFELPVGYRGPQPQVG